jgi:uncharacterized protein (DUF58 family)
MSRNELPTQPKSTGVTASIEELIQLQALTQARCHWPTLARANTFGNYSSRLRGRGMQFSEVRNYQAGDEVRHMEWRVTARTGRPHVKLYQEERERPVLLITDFNPSLYFGTRVAFKSVLAARLTALFAWRALHQGDKVGGVLFSAEQHHEFSPHSRHAHIMKILGYLAHYTTQFPARPTPPMKPLSEILLRIRRVNKPGSLIILISDFYCLDQQSDQHLMHLRQHNDILAVHLYDPLEMTLPTTGLFPFTDQQNNLLLDADDPDTAEAYRAFWAQRHLDLKQRCQRLGLLYTSINATQNLTPILSQAFPGKHHAI